MKEQKELIFLHLASPLTDCFGLVVQRHTHRFAISLFVEGLGLILAIVRAAPRGIDLNGVPHMLGVNLSPGNSLEATETVFLSMAFHYLSWRSRCLIFV